MTNVAPRYSHAKRRSLVLAIAMTLALAACTAAPGTAPGTSATAAVGASVATGAGNTIAAAEGLPGWSDVTHGKSAAPNYAVAYPQGKVSEFRIVIEPADWDAMMADMTRLYGARGGQQGAGPGDMGQRGPRGGQAGAVPRQPGASPQPRPSMSPGASPAARGGPAPGGLGGQGGPGGMMGGNRERPMWVPATIIFDGRAWTKVGVRFKGNSSLMTAWRSNTERLPFKIDFDEFEGDFPALKDQRFHGFKQLSLSTNFGDAAHMRDAIAYEVLDEAGLVASKTTHYEIMLDHGQGAASLGLYTAIEVTDDTVVDRHFGSDKGNIYEGDGPAVSLAEGVRANIKSSFQKENNEDSDWSDLEKLYDALHAPTRTTDPVAWRAGLEAVFDVETYLEWLAIAALLQHWDTYGGMSHNFYIYNDANTSKLTWISWDHNLILGSSGPGGGPGGEVGGFGGAPPLGPDGQPLALPSGMAFPPDGPGRGGMGRNVSFDKAGVTASWPLIRFLMDDPMYNAKYVTYLDEAVRGPFEPSKMMARVDKYAAYLAPHAAKQPEGAAGYDTSVKGLRTAIENQVKAAKEFLSK